MRHYETTLEHDQSTEIEAGLNVVPRIQTRPNGSRDTVLQVELQGQQLLELPGAVDTSGGPNDLATHVALTDDARTIFVIGGRAAYRWNIVKDPERIPLFRDPKHEEYWDTKMMNVGPALLVVYEAGIMLLEGELRVRWHQPKLYNDLFLEVGLDMVWFESDVGQRWALALANGSKLDI